MLTGGAGLHAGAVDGGLARLREGLTRGRASVRACCAAGQRCCAGAARAGAMEGKSGGASAGPAAAYQAHPQRWGVLAVYAAASFMGALVWNILVRASLRTPCATRFCLR